MHSDRNGFEHDEFRGVVAVLQMQYHALCVGRRTKHSENDEVKTDV